MQLPVGRGQFNSNPHSMEQWESSAENWHSVFFILFKNGIFIMFSRRISRIKNWVKTMLKT